MLYYSVHVSKMFITDIMYSYSKDKDRRVPLLARLHGAHAYDVARVRFQGFAHLVLCSCTTRLARSRLPIMEVK